MFDTTKLTHAYPFLPAPDDFESRGIPVQFGKTERDGQWAIAKINPFRGGATKPRVTITWRERGINTVAAEVSAPKMMLGSNVQELSDADAFLDACTDHVSRVVGLDFDAHTALVRRIDFCQNFQVGEANVKAYIDAAGQATPPRLSLAKYPTGVSFRSGSRQLVVYGKYAEVEKLNRRGKASDGDLRAAAGLLRVEPRYMTSGACTYLAERLGLPNRQAQFLLQRDVFENVMTDAIKSLNLDSPVVSSDDRLDALLHAFGKRRATDMAGFLEYRDEHGEEFWKRLGISYETFRRKRKMLRDVGLWTAAPSRHTLPSLRLVEPVWLAEAA
jgi:hypothetical protein